MHKLEKPGTAKTGLEECGWARTSLKRLGLHRPGRVWLGTDKPEKSGTAWTGLEECGWARTSLKNLELHRPGRVWLGMDKLEKRGREEVWLHRQKDQVELDYHKQEVEPLSHAGNEAPDEIHPTTAMRRIVPGHVQA